MVTYDTDHDNDRTGNKTVTLEDYNQWVTGSWTLTPGPPPRSHQQGERELKYNQSQAKVLFTGLTLTHHS